MPPSQIKSLRFLLLYSLILLAAPAGPARAAVPMQSSLRKPIQAARHRKPRAIQKPFPIALSQKPRQEKKTRDRVAKKQKTNYLLYFLITAGGLAAAALWRILTGRVGPAGKPTSLQPSAGGPLQDSGSIAKALSISASRPKEPVREPDKSDLPNGASQEPGQGSNKAEEDKKPEERSKGADGEGKEPKEESNQPAEEGKESEEESKGLEGRDTEPEEGGKEAGEGGNGADGEDKEPKEESEGVDGEDKEPDEESEELEEESEELDGADQQPDEEREESDDEKKYPDEESPELDEELSEEELEMRPLSTEPVVPRPKPGGQREPFQPQTPAECFLYAAEKGELPPLVEYLKDPSIANNINTLQDEHQNTALILAASNGHTAIVKKLLEAGADPDVRDKLGRTALIAASHSGHADIVRLLLEGEADSDLPKANPNLAGKNGYTALMLAALLGHEQVVKVLVACPDLKPNLENHDGNTALMLTPTQAIAKCLLSRADINLEVVNKSYKKAKDIAPRSIQHLIAARAAELARRPPA